MKKLLILAAAAALCSCSSNKYVIEGNIEDLTGTVYLVDKENNVVDSTTVENGKFRFKGDAEIPAIRLVRDAADDSASINTMLIIEPGTITITDDAENPVRKSVGGTPANDALTAYGAAGNALIMEYRNPETTDERREAIEEEYDQLSRTAVDANRDNYFGAMLLAQELAYGLSGQELLDEIAKFPEALQQSDVLVELKKNAEAKIRTDVGQPYIDVTQNNAEGEPVSLKSVVENPANKYVLLDFWASWCRPCMEEVPHLKKTYDEFHSKGFEIFGVSFDNDREKWLAAVAQNDMAWVQVSELNGFDNQAARDYAIQGIPSNFLIDAQGKIVAQNLRGEALYEKISELLAE